MHAAIWVVFAVTFAARTEADSQAGENSAAFAALCGPIRLATSTPRILHAKDEADSIIATIATINLTIADDTFTNKIDHDKTWRTAPEDYKKSRPGWDKYHDTWAAAKKEIAGDKKQKYTNWKSFKGNKAAQEQVSHIAEEAFTIKSELDKLKAKLNGTDVAAALTKAIHGETGAETKSFRINFGQSWEKRAELCSQTGGRTTQMKPGTSLLMDSVCLCANGKESVGNKGKACCDKCDDTETADKTEVTPQTDFKKKWEKLTQACDKLAPKPPLNTQTVAQAVATMSTELKHKTQTQTTHDNLLGTINDNGSSGCTGNNNNKGGKCVVYKDGLTATGENAVQWLRHLETAAKAEEARQHALQGLESKADKLEVLNKTLERLLLALRNSAGVSSPTPATATEPTKSSKANKEEAEKECNAAGDDKTECGKKTGCTYDAANKKCTLSEEAKQAAEAANQETGGKDGKPTNTTGSNSVLINKAPILLAVLLF